VRNPGSKDKKSLQTASQDFKKKLSELEAKNTEETVKDNSIITTSNQNK
jgi:hypothetical protein